MTASASPWRDVAAVPGKIKSRDSLVCLYSTGLPEGLPRQRASPRDPLCVLRDLLCEREGEERGKSKTWHNESRQESEEPAGPWLAHKHPWGCPQGQPPGALAGKAPESLFPDSTTCFPFPFLDFNF